MEKPLQGLSILIVEDEPLIALDIAQAFKEAGAQLTTTTTLKQALILVENDGLSAAILDHSLHDGDAAAVYRRLKERNIPFVIYSGHSKVDGLYQEVPFVQKPAAPDILVTTVKGLLDEGAERERHASLVHQPNKGTPPSTD